MNAYLSLNQYCSERNVALVAVSKTKPIEAIQNLYHHGQRVFGENRVQELAEKYESLPKDIEWHMIGHLQTNKVKTIAPFVSLVHSGDRRSILKELNKEAQKNSRTIDVLLQIKIAEEDSKYGWDAQELKDQLEQGLVDKYDYLRFRGVMGMATFTDNEEQITQEFSSLKKLFDTYKKQYFQDSPAFDTVSMGMSGDYKIAVSQGSTMIRIGSLLFGARS